MGTGQNVSRPARVPYAGFCRSFARSAPGATFKVTLINANEGLNRTIDCPDNQPILAAAAEQDIDLPFSCRGASRASRAGKPLSGSGDGLQWYMTDSRGGSASMMPT